MASAIMMIVFLSMIVISIPVCAAMGSGALLGLLLLDLPISTAPRLMLEKVEGVPFLAVPFFILTANLMKEFKIIDRIFSFANDLVGSITGGLAQVNIFAAMIFSGISGSALADIGGLGNVTIVSMEKAGYRREFAAALVVASSVIGPIIPPSIPFIIYALLSDLSVGRLFFAGIIPGIVIGVLLMVTVVILVKLRVETYVVHAKFDMIRVLGSAAKASPALLTPIIILSGMVAGIMTPTEASVVAALYSLLLGFVYREFSVTRVYAATVDTIKATSVVMFLTGIGAIMAFVLTTEQIADILSAKLVMISGNKYILLLYVNIFVLILGCVLETIPALLIVVPVFVPALVKIGIDPYQFGVVLTLNLMIGIMTPPIGMGLFAISAIANLKLEAVIRSSVIFFPTLLVALGLLTYIPSITLWLPNLVFGK